MDESEPRADGTAEPEQAPGHPGAVIDFSAALHIAGHESELLGLDGVADAGPLVHADTPEESGESAEELAHRIGSNFIVPGPPEPE